MALIMDKVNNLWVACDKYGSLKLFFEEPYSVEGEWYSNSDSAKEIDNSLVKENISYEESPQKVLLVIRDCYFCHKE